MWICEIHLRNALRGSIMENIINYNRLRMVYKMSVCIQHWRGIQPKLQQTYQQGQYIDAQEVFLKINLLLAKTLGFIVIKNNCFNNFDQTWVRNSIALRVPYNIVLTISLEKRRESEAASWTVAGLASIVVNSLSGRKNFCKRIMEIMNNERIINHFTVEAGQQLKRRCVKLNFFLALPSLAPPWVRRYVPVSEIIYFYKPSIFFFNNLGFKIILLYHFI